MNPPRVSKRGRPPGRTVGHGTRTMYCYYRCRCELCTDGERLYQKRRKLRKLREEQS